jgi:hypothetical protein
MQVSVKKTNRKIIVPEPVKQAFLYRYAAPAAVLFWRSLVEIERQHTTDFRKCKLQMAL